MKCRNEAGCSGEVNLERSVPLRVSCVAFKPAFACATCRRLHWESGHPVISRQELRVFLDGDEAVQRDVDGTEIHRLPVGL